MASYWGWGPIPRWPSTPASISATTATSPVPTPTTCSTPVFATSGDVRFLWLADIERDQHAEMIARPHASDRLVEDEARLEEGGVRLGVIVPASDQDVIDAAAMVGLA